MSTRDSHRQKNPTRILSRSLLSFGLCASVFLSQTPCSFGFGITTRSSTTTSSARRSPLWQSSTNNQQAEANNKLEDLKVIIAGAGPAGLLLAHLLLQQGATVSVYESRPDPRGNSKAALAGFAYALGLGIRGRTAIRSVDERLWQTVKSKGNECDRFRLHVGPFNFKLRDSMRTRRKQQKKKKNKETIDNSNEPSLLLFQADLCIALMEELERRYGGNGGGDDEEDNDNDSRFQLQFTSRVVDCDLEKQRVIIDKNKNDETILGEYDLLVGCDGVNSIVRSAMKSANPLFTADKQTLPGEFKVAKLDSVPPKLDPNSVSLIVPKSGTSTAFLEPTVNGTSCILFAGRGGPDNPIMSGVIPNPEQTEDDDRDTESNSNSINRTEALAETILESFPILAGVDVIDVADQLIAQKPGSASSVTCNVYHYDSSVVIAGDAAHATGGVSGQGVNSALMDSAVLSDCLLKYYDPSFKRESLERSLLSYSQRQVPEGKALYDLSFGPKPTGFKRVFYFLKGMRDTIFQGRLGIGKPPLQTMLTTSLESFSSIRRKLNYYYDTAFPSSDFFNREISSVYTNKETVDELNKVEG